MPGPLHGIRIIDLSAHISGPFGTALLADQGAEVIKVEPVGMGDGMRYSAPARGGMSAMFAAINRNKRSIALDIRSEAGRAVLMDLIGTADVLVQNFRPGVIQRLGFSHDQIVAAHPSIISVSINGFGADGPDAQRRAYDGIIQASVGIPTMQSDTRTGEPLLIRTAICDKLTALFVSQAITAALLARERDSARRGQHVEVPMMDSAIWFLWPDTMANHTFVGENVPQSVEFEEHFRLRKTRDGSLMVVATSQQEFDAICAVLGRPDLSKDDRFSTPKARGIHLREVNDALAPLFAECETDAVYEALVAADVPVARVNDHLGVINDPQVRLRGIVTEVEDPAGGLMRRARHPIRFGSTEIADAAPPPMLGQHSREILRGLGYDDQRIETLIEARAVAA